MSESVSPFEVLFGGAAPKQKEPPVRPLMEAQRMELLMRFDRYRVHHNIEPGDLVAEKDGLGYFPSVARERVALIFWRMLDADSASDKALIEDFVGGHRNFDKIDCLVAHTSDDGEILLFTPCARQNLRLLNADEIAAFNAVATSSDAVENHAA